MNPYPWHPIGMHLPSGYLEANNKVTAPAKSPGLAQFAIIDCKARKMVVGIPVASGNSRFKHLEYSEQLKEFTTHQCSSCDSSESSSQDCTAPKTLETALQDPEDHPWAKTQYCTSNKTLVLGMLTNGEYCNFHLEENTLQRYHCSCTSCEGPGNLEPRYAEYSEHLQAPVIFAINSVSLAVEQYVFDPTTRGLKQVHLENFYCDLSHEGSQCLLRYSDDSMDIVILKSERSMRMEQWCARSKKYQEVPMPVETLRDQKLKRDLENQRARRKRQQPEGLGSSHEMVEENVKSKKMEDRAFQSLQSTSGMGTSDAADRDPSKLTALLDKLTPTSAALNLSTDLLAPVSWNSGPPASSNPGALTFPTLPGSSTLQPTPLSQEIDSLIANINKSTSPFETQAALDEMLRAMNGSSSPGMQNEAEMKARDAAQDIQRIADLAPSTTTHQPLPLILQPYVSPTGSIIMPQLDLMTPESSQLYLKLAGALTGTGVTVDTTQFKRNLMKGIFQLPQEKSGKDMRPSGICDETYTSIFWAPIVAASMDREEEAPRLQKTSCRRTPKPLPSRTALTVTTDSQRPQCIVSTSPSVTAQCPLGAPLRSILPTEEQMKMLGNESRWTIRDSSTRGLRLSSTFDRTRSGAESGAPSKPETLNSEKLDLLGNKSPDSSYPSGEAVLATIEEEAADSDFTYSFSSTPELRT